MTKALMEAARLYDDLRFLSKSELRIIANKKKRQRIVRRQKLAIILGVAILVFLIAFLRNPVNLSAQSDDYVPTCKYYKVIMVHADDTLWSLSDQYYDADRYSSFDSYISEVCRINHLADADSIKAGENIVMPYYGAVSVK